MPSSTPDLVKPEAVLVTGVYGVGKSTVVAQMADLLEAGGQRYAAIDLDWLGWADTGWELPHSDDRLLLMNLASVVGNYRGAGIERFAVAGWLENGDELVRLRSTMAMPLRVVRLVLPIEEIRRRIGPGENTGRADDVAQSTEWIASGAGMGLEDRAVANDRPVVEVARDILVWMGWA